MAARWLPAIPVGVGGSGAVGPRKPVIRQSVSQSNPGPWLLWDIARDEVVDKVLLLVAVDGRQVGVLGPAVLLRFPPAHGCRDVPEAATVEPHPVLWTGFKLQLRLCLQGNSAQGVCTHTRTRTHTHTHTHTHTTPYKAVASIQKMLGYGNY